MGYNWESKVSITTEGNGTIDAYQAVADSLEILAILSYSPILPISPKEKHIVALLFIKGEKSNLTDGQFHWIHDDLAEIVENRCGNIYAETGSVEFYLTNVLFVDELPNIDYFSHGTYSLQ